MEEIFKKYPLLKEQNVPRETLIEFEYLYPCYSREMMKLI